MEKFVLEIELGDDMRSPDDLAWALHRVASTVQGGTATGKIRDLCGDFVGKFDIEKAPDPAPDMAEIARTTMWTFTSTGSSAQHDGHPVTMVRPAAPHEYTSVDGATAVWVRCQEDGGLFLVLAEELSR